MNENKETVNCLNCNTNTAIKRGTSKNRTLYVCSTCKHITILRDDGSFHLAKLSSYNEKGEPIYKTVNAPDTISTGSIQTRLSEDKVNDFIKQLQQIQSEQKEKQ